MKKRIRLQKLNQGIYEWLIDKKHLTKVLALIVLLLAALTRFLPITQPQTSMVFDESYFVPQVESYPVNRYYFDPHPPLGKFLMYLGMMAVNPDAAEKIEPDKLGNLVNNYKSNLDLTGIRLAPQILGTLVPVLVMLITLQIILWRKKEVGEGAFIKANMVALAAGTMAALDNTLIVESRYALLTQIMLFFMLLAVFLSLKYLNAFKPIKIELYFIATSIAVGAAVTVKWLALSIIPFILLIVLYKEYKDKVQFNWPVKTLISVLVQRVLFMLLTGLMIYIGMFAWHFSQMKNYSPAADELSAAHIADLKNGTNEVGLLTKIMEWQRIAGNYSKGVPALDYTKKDEIGSMWITWPIMARPINYYWQTDGDGLYGQIYLIGNPVVWVASLIGVFSLSALGFSRIFGKNRFGIKHALLVLLFLANWLPFALITRVMYMYHYIPAMVIGIIMVAVFVHDFLIPAFSNLQKLPQIGTIFKGVNIRLFLFCLAIFAVALAYVFYSPLTYAQKLSREEWSQRVLLKEWNMKWPGGE